MITVPRLPVGQSIEYFLDKFVAIFADTTRACSLVIEHGIEFIEQGLFFLPP